MQVFELYRTSPQYLEVNAGMSLAEFRGIFWWEYFHGLWGRVIGLVFFIPFVWFLIRGYVRGAPTLKLTGFSCWAAHRGSSAGTWSRAALSMCRRSASNRLTAHLSLAFLIYGLLVWTALSILFPTPMSIGDRHHNQTRALAQIALGPR